MADITNGYNAILSGNQDENYIGLDEIKRMLLQDREIAKMQAYRLIYAEMMEKEKAPLSIKPSKYSKYISSVEDTYRQDEIKALKLSILDKAVNGTFLFAVNTLATVLDNTLGTAAGIASAGYQGAKYLAGDREKPSIGDALIDGFINNPITAGMQGLRDLSKEVAPIYRTEQLGNRSVGEMLTDPNFWFDDMLVNAGFTVGSMLSMYNGAYGTLKNPNGFFSTAKYVATNPMRSAQAFSNKIRNKTTFGKELTRIERSRKYKLLGKINSLINDVEKLTGFKPVRTGAYVNYNTTKGKLWNAWKASSGEARMEAYNAYSDFITDLNDALEERYNKDYDSIINSNQSEDQKKLQIKKLDEKYNRARNSLQGNASKLAAAVFALNKLILTLSNVVDLQFFIRPIVKNKPNLTIRTESKINALKKTGVRSVNGVEEKVSINELAKEGNLTAKSLKECKILLKQEIDLLGGEKALNELLEKATEQSVKTGKNVSEILDGYINTAAVIDGVFRDVSTSEIVEGALNAINVERKLITNNNKLTKTIDYMFGNAKTKRQAIIQGLVIKPTQEGWEELSQAWAEENAKSFYSSELESIMNDRKNDRSALNLFDPAGIVGLITSIFTAPLSNSKGPFATTDSWNTVWKDRWNEGFMGSMTGLLGTINPAGMYTKRKMKKAAKKRYDIIAERNKSLKEALKLNDEDFKEIFADQALAEENARKLYEDWSKLKISRDVWANELFNALDEADEYKKNILLSVDNALKYYADTTAVKARIRKIAESLSAARKSEFEDIDHQLAVTAALEALLAQISEAYDLGISSDFIQKIKEVYKDIEKTDEDRDKDETEIIREHLKNIGFIEDDNDNDDSTEDNRKRTVFDNIMLDSREHKIDRANEILKAIRDNILEKAIKYENLRLNLDDEKYNSLSNENKDLLAKAYVMYDDALKNLVDILNSDISGEIGLSLINFVNKTIESDATGENRTVYYIDNNGKINKATVGKDDKITIEGGEVKIEKENGETEVVAGKNVEKQEFIDELLNNNFAEKITKKIGRIRSLGQRAAFLLKQKEELNEKTKGREDTNEEEKLKKELNNAYKKIRKEYLSLINSLLRPYLDEDEGIYGHHGPFNKKDYIGYFRFLQIKQKEENRGKSNRELLKILDKEYKDEFNLDHIAQMVDRNLVLEFEEIKGNLIQTKTSNERFIPVNDRSLYTTTGVISTEGEADIVANKKIVENQWNMMETFIKSFLKATSLHKAISAALDNIDKFKEKSDQYRLKYDDMMEDHKVDEFFRWIDSDNLFEVYDLLDNIDTMCSDVVIEGDEAVVRSNLNKEQLIAIRLSVLERLERNNPELLNRVLQLDFAMDVVRKAAVKINDTDYIVVKRKEKDNDGKEVDVLEKISLNELEESIRKDFSGKSNKDLLSINFNEIIKDKIEKLEGSKYDDADKTKEDKEKEAEKTLNAIDKLSELVNVTSNLVINRGEGNNRRGGHLSLNRRIYETDDMKEVGKALLITENSEGGPIDNSGKEDKKEKDEDEGKEKELGNSNEPEANEEKNETEEGKEENNEPEASLQGEGENNNEENNEDNNKNNNEIEDNIKGGEAEELGNQNNEPKEKRKAKEEEEKEEENTGGNNEVNDKEYSEGKPNPSQEGSVRSYRCPAFEHSKTVKEDGIEKLDPGLEHKVLKENNDTNARVARLIYQDFIDGGYLRRIIERKEKSEDQVKKESAKDLVLMKIHFDEKNSGGNSAISQKIYNFIYKDLDDSRKKDEAKKINSIIWLAIELDNYTPEEYKNFNNCVEHRGKWYALVGMYDDPQNVDAINEKFLNQEKSEIKVLEAESEDGKSEIVTTSITKMYSGRIANKTSDGKRQRLRRIDENTFKDILVYTHVNKGFVAFGDLLNLSEDYKTNDEQNRIDSILDENRGDGAYYALIKANDGRYYRIALRVARYNEDFVGVEEGVVLDKLIERSENELNINNRVASINKITQEMARNIVQFLKGERKGSVQDLITNGRKEMLNYLCLIKVPVSGEEGKFDYDRLEIKLNEGNIELYFSYNKDENGEVRDDKKIVFTKDYIDKLKNEQGIEGSLLNNEIAERIRELYMKENFRFRLPLKAAVGGTERNVTTEELIKTELLYIDLAGKKLPDGLINIFNDSSFEVALVTIDEHNIVKVGDRTFNVNKVEGVGKRRPMFAGLGIERKEYKGRVQVELDMGGGETLIARFEDGNEKNVPTIYICGNEENINDDTNWTKIGKNDSRYYLGIAAYSYMTDYGNVNLFRANVWYPLADSTNKVFAFIKTDGEGKVVKYVEYDDNIKAAIKIDEETLHSIQRRFRPIEPGTLSDMLDIYALKNNKNSTVKWTNMAMGILTDTIEKTYEEIRKRDSITDQEAKNIVQAAYDSAKDDAKGFNLEEEKLKSMEDDEQELYESVKLKLEDTILLFKKLSNRKLKNLESEIKGPSLKAIVNELLGKTTKYDEKGIRKVLEGKKYKELLDIAFEIAYDIEIADDLGCKS